MNDLYHRSMAVCPILVLGCLYLLLSGCSTYDYYAPMEALTGSVRYDDRDPVATLNVASVAMECRKDDKASNVATMVDFINRIAGDHPDVDLIVFGETTLGWYEVKGDQPGYQRRLSEPIPGPTTDQISELAVKYGTYITFGMVQIRDGGLYNAQPVIAPNGDVIAVHHKTMLTPSDEDAAYRKGNGLTVVDIKGVTTGVVICKDQENSLLTREVARSDCELVILSFADDVVEDFP